MEQTRFPLCRDGDARSQEFSKPQSGNYIINRDGNNTDVYRDGVYANKPAMVFIANELTEAELQKLRKLMDEYLNCIK